MTRPLDTLSVDELDALADEPCGFVVTTDAPIGLYLTPDAEAALERVRPNLRLVTS